MSTFDEEGAGPIAIGRNRYKAQDYKGALEKFSEAMECSTGHLRFTALDYRAATYEKLGQLQGALRDAKGMIDGMPGMAKGYLRCAKVLQLKGEKELALKIYERGLGKVKIGADENRVTLQAMYNKLRQALEPEKTRDPLVYLPLEMAQSIVEHLEFREKVICLAVSRPWKKLLESSHKFWTTIDTTRARKEVTKTALRAYLRRSNFTLSKAVISHVAHFDEKKFVFLTKTCTELKELEVNGGGVIGQSLISALPFAKSLTSLTISERCEISKDAIIEALTLCQKTLVHANFQNVCKFWMSSEFGALKLEALMSLRLRGGLPGGDCEISYLLKMAPNLKVMSISNIILNGRNLLGVGKAGLWESSLEVLELVRVQTDVLPKLPPTLKHLNVSENPHLKWHVMEEDETCELPLLESLNCYNTGFGPSLLHDFTASSIKAGNLKRLSIGARHSDTGVSVVTDEYPASDTLDELSLKGLQVSESRILEIVALYPKLQKIDVSSTKVSGVAVKHFMKLGINWIGLNECNNVGADAVDYARSQGVEVEFKFPSRAKGKSFRDAVSGGFYVSLS